MMSFLFLVHVPALVLFCFLFLFLFFVLFCFVCVLPMTSFAMTSGLLSYVSLISPIMFVIVLSSFLSLTGVT